MMEELLERAARRADAAEVFAVTSEEVPVSFEANRFKLLQTRQSRGVALRVIKDGRIGLVATNRLEKMDALVDAALEVAPFGPEAHLELPGPMAYPDVPVYDPSTERAAVEHMVLIGEGLISRLRDHTPDIKCDGGVSRSVATIEILNSRGCRVAYRKSVFSVGVTGLIVRDTDMLYVGESEVGCAPLEDYSFLVDETIRQIEMARRHAQVTSRPLPVIFTPHGVGSALAPALSLAFNGRLVFQGSSPLAGRLGDLVFHPKLTVWDDPTIPYRPASSPCDDEGVPVQRTTLVEAGIVANFLYDLQTAGLAGTRSTGSASRGLESLPSPSTSALIIGTGDASFEEMVASMQEGLIVDYVIGATQGNVVGGDFGGNVLLGFKVERGEIVGRVKNTMIAGNIYDILKRIVSLGKEAHWVGGSLRTPHIYVESVSVASKE